MRFSDHFWNIDICDFTGFEIICQRLKEGRRFIKDYAEFLKQRALVEEAYGNSMMKLTKSAGGRYEIGTLRQAWEVILNQTELVGFAHLSHADQLNKEKTRTLEFVGNLSKRSKERACQTLEANNVKRQKHKQLQEGKRMYFMRCRESTLYSDYLTEETKKQKFQERELEMTFQALDAERICFLKDSMWSVANMLTSLYLNENESSEEIKKGLKNIVAGTDLDLFIRQKQTGTVRPDMTDCHMALNNEYESLDLEGESEPRDGQFLRVLYEYKSENDSVISVFEKDVVRLLRKENNEWWEVETKDGRKGYFPANYLTPLMCSSTEEN
ncbi:proline-serine-threonine phosphatase-interacting protein 1-like isoform X3 [Tachypleus tridentatus]|uniref:proline-serine-threonine phosphatase-interacting protein 1-like isoform X3 n=1 Tax=Tachypleus tridentatus TaxID=6853 RepID=UPI003FD486FA